VVILPMNFEYKRSFALTPAQKVIEASKARFKYVKAGRRFGKTKYLVSWLIERALMLPGEEAWYVAPSYRMAKEIGWHEFLAQIPEELIRKKNDRELYIELINDARICLKGSEDEDSLRGRRLGSLGMEEAEDRHFQLVRVGLLKHLDCDSGFHAGRDAMIEKLKTFQIYWEVHTLAGAPHTFWLFLPWFEETSPHIVGFLNRVLKGKNKRYCVISEAVWNHWNLWLATFFHPSCCRRS